jgi:heterodisulfide reductase subunit A
MANIREHCSWVHSKQKEEATKKAKDIVRMSVARSVHLEPLEEFDLPVNKAGLVVGGGLAGMTSALAIANQGFEVHLVEKEKDLGGLARRIHYTLDGLDVQANLKDIIRKVYEHPLIHVSHEATITDVSGYVGNFTTTVKSEGQVKEIQHGVVILATGADEYSPAEYLYGEDERVLTQLELEEHITKGDDRVMKAQSLVMIQCVGCREKDRNYCARICCNVAIKNALKLKEINPEMDIYILFRDMRTYGFAEEYYREAADQDVKFIRWEPDDRPQVESTTEGDKPVLRVTVPDPVLGQRLVLDADLLVLSASLIPSNGSQEIARLFKAPLSPDGFFQEAHVKLRPVDFAAEGVFLCGTAHYPKHIPETISQAYGAAGRAVTLLSQEYVTASGAVCEVNEDECVSCGACITACAYGAIEFRETSKGKKAYVNPVLCTGDGLCNAKCPTNAIMLKHYTDDEIYCQIDAAVLHAEDDQPTNE